MAYKHTYLFLHSPPLSSYGSSLPRLAPNLHLCAGTALTIKQRAGSVTCTGANATTQPAPRSVHCSVLTPASLAAALSHLAQATLGTS